MAFIRTSKRGSGKLCPFCRERSANRLCDFVVDATTGKTCDAEICGFCAHRVDRNHDFCPSHRPSGAQFTPRQDKNTPRWIEALWAGVCRKCFRPVKIGERILWFKTQKRLFCEDCGKAFKEMEK